MTDAAQELFERGRRRIHNAEHIAEHIAAVEQKLSDLFGEAVEMIALERGVPHICEGDNHENKYIAHVAYDGVDNKGGRAEVWFKCYWTGRIIEDFDVKGIWGSHIMPDAPFKVADRAEGGGA